MQVFDVYGYLTNQYRHPFTPQLSLYLKGNRLFHTDILISRVGASNGRYFHSTLLTLYTMLWIVVTPSMLVHGLARD